MTQTDQQNVPKLRFPGFDGAWESKKVSDVFHVTRGQVLAVPKMTQEPTEASPYPVFSSQTKNNGLTGYYSDYLFENAVTWTTDGAKAGDVRYRSGKFYCTNVCGVLISEDGFANQFASESLNRITHKYVSYVGNPKLMNNVMGGIQYYLPTLPEQRKIASFLSAVDTKIAQLARKKALLEDYKKGCMQQIFSQKIRFKDEKGQDFPDWEEKRLEEVATINPKSSALPETFLYIDLESVSHGQLTEPRQERRNTAPSRAQRLLQAEDILFQLVRPYQRNNYFFPGGKTHVASTGYAVLRAKDHPPFLYQSIHEDSFVNRVLERCTGTNYPAINSNDLAKVQLSVPHPDEQRKIASFLSALDRKIDLVGKELIYAQSFKQGLLQQMFV